MLRVFGRSVSMRVLLPIAMISWLAIGEAGLGHSCPTHWSAPASSDASHSHAAHGDAGGDNATDPLSSHGSCTCVGACSAAAGATIPAAPISADECVLGALEPNAPVAALGVAAIDAHHVLPYANGPPAL